MEHDETIVTECLSSTDVWLRFKKDNKEYVDENKLTTEQFRNYIKSFLEIEEYVEKSKKGAIEIKYYRFRDLLVTQDSKNEKKENKMDVELTIPNNVEKKKKVIKKRKGKIVVSEELDKEVVEMYNHSDTNIMEISDAKNIQVWQVVSILIIAGVIGPTSNSISTMEDVDVVNLADGGLLIYSSSTNKWTAGNLLEKQIIESGQY